jgi:hypothetical protein
MRIASRVAMVAIVLGSLFGASSAWGQSIYGPGGLFLNPTADFPAKGQLTPAVLVLPQENALSKRRTWMSYSVDYGLRGDLEIGVTHLKVNPGQAGSTGGSFKYRLVQGRRPGAPDVAVGAGFLTGGDVNAAVVFTALRFTFEPYRRHAGHVHLGLLYADRLIGNQRRNTLPFGGLDVALTDNLTLFGEMRSRSTRPASAADLKPPSAVGLVWSPTRLTKIVIAYADNGRSRIHKLSFGVGYRIGLRR